MAAAIRLRTEARKLQALAEEAERSARDAACTALGEESGDLAFKLVSSTLPPDPAMHDPALAQEFPAVPGEERRREQSPTASYPEAGGGSKTTRPAARVDAATEPEFSVPAPPVESRPVQGNTATVPERESILGISFPAHRKAEAEEIVKRAEAASAAGHRNNPYEGNRGKNAWRPKLYQEALRAARPPAPIPREEAATGATGHHGGTPSGPVEERPVRPSPSVAPAAEATPIPEGDPLDDADSSPLTETPATDESKTQKPKPAPARSASLRPGFGAAVPMPRNFKAPPGVRPHESRARPPDAPAFLNRNKEG